MNRIERQFEAVGDAELIKDIVQVILYGLLASRSSTRTIRSRRLVIAASRRSESSGERKDAIAASAIRDLGWPRLDEKASRDRSVEGSR